MHATFAVPGNINMRNGGMGYNRKVLALLPQFGVQVQHLQLPSNLPNGTPEELAQATRLMALVPPDQVLLVDSLGLSCLDAPLRNTIHAPVVALVHHPLSAELGLSGAAAQGWDKAERAALDFAHAVVVSSPYTARQLVDDFAVSRDKITIAVPGTVAAARARGSSRDGQVQMLCVGSVIARKGYEFLFDALKDILHFDWHLTIAGSQSLDAAYARQLIQAVNGSTLAARVTLHDEMSAEQLELLYQNTDIFLMPSLFEGYGMALAEAMARGLPIVCTTGGAASQTVPDGAGLKVPPANSEALKLAIESLLHSPELRAQTADKSWQAGQKLPDWPASVKLIAQVVKNARVAF